MFHRPKSEESESPQQVSEQTKETEVKQPEQVTEQPPVVQSAMQQSTETTQVKEEKAMNYEQTENQDKEERAAEAPTGAPFQRPPQMQRSVPGFAAGSNYPGAGAHGGSEIAGDRKLVIGQGITMSGEIEACDYLLVEGTLEAALKGAKVLEIADTGTFYGAVEIEEATVGGRFEGELTVNGRLTIKSGGSVTGTVAYKELAIEAGATLDGKVSPLASMGAARAESPKKTMAPKNDNAGEEGSELPFSGSAIAAAE